MRSLLLGLTPKDVMEGYESGYPTFMLAIDQTSLVGRLVISTNTNRQNVAYGVLLEYFRQSPSAVI